MLPAKFVRVENPIWQDAKACGGACSLEPCWRDGSGTRNHERQNQDNRLSGVTRPESFTGFAAVAPCMLWCDRALEGLQKAANDFVRRYGLELLHEF